jgi:hypothetical protein
VAAAEREEDFDFLFLLFHLSLVENFGIMSSILFRGAAGVPNEFNPGVCSL